MSRRILLIFRYFFLFSILLLGSTTSLSAFFPPLSVITPTNAAELSELSRLGNGWTHGVAWSSDGKQIAVASSIGIFLYDPETLRLLRYIETNQWIKDVAFSPGGHLLATVSWTADANQLRIWDAASGELLYALEGGVNQFAFSPDESMIATATQTGVHVWDLNTGTISRTFDTKLGSMPGIAFTADGLLVITSIGLWDPKTDELLHEFHLGSVSCLALNSDTQILAWANYDSPITMTDIETGETLRQLQGDTSSLIWNLAFSPDGRYVASGGSDSYVRLWDANSGEQLRVLKGHRDWAYGVAFSPDSRTLATAGWDATVRFWDVQTGNQLRILTGHTSHVDEIDISTSGHLIIANSRVSQIPGDESWGAIQFWQFPEGKLLRTFYEKQYSIAIKYPC